MVNQQAEVLEFIKSCTKCGENKATDNFGKAARNPNKLQSVCKTCVSARQREWEQKNIKRNLKGFDLSKPQICRTCKTQKSTNNFYRRANTKSGLDSECADCAKERDKKRYRRDIEKRKHQNKWATLKMKFGITKDHWQKMLTSQNGACAICRKIFDRSDNTHVDHDHQTGRVRGLLCRKCNFAVGLLSDDPGTFDRAAKYLRDNQKE